MDDIPIAFAKDHLEDLVARARRGEVVTINDGHGPVQLTSLQCGDVTAARVTESLAPFMPLAAPRTAGRLEGKIAPPPDGFFAPLNDDELKDWYGDEA